MTEQKPDITTTEDNTEIAARKLSKAETAFQNDVNAVYAKATAADKKAAANLLSSGAGIRKEEISSTVAAAIMRDYNLKNRDFNIAKALGYRDAMKRGEWKLNHQGIAAYPDGTLADGQHRMGGLALADLDYRLPFYVASDFDKDAIDTIDRSGKRTAGEALEMMGVGNGKQKAQVAKKAMEYAFEVENKRRPTYTDPQIERWVLDHDETLDSALHIGRMSVDNISDPCLSTAEASLIALLMLLGNWGEQATVSYIASIQQGVATYPESPTVTLSKLYMRAKINARKNDRLGWKAKTALAMKGAALWMEEKTVARMSWNPTKETLPSNIKPIGIYQDAA
jgi:hypothetical protein